MAMDQDDITDALPFLFEGSPLFFIPENKKTPELPQHLGQPPTPVQVCVSYSEADFMPEGDYELLGKILGAVNVPMDKVTIWNTPERPETESTPHFMLYFTENKEDKYVWHQQETTHLLYADPLTEIAQHVALKKQLWAALQQADFSAGV